MAPPGRRAKRLELPQLRAARQARGWTEDDLATAVLDVAESLGEPEPKISGGQVSKWERGNRNPGLYYRSRLCLALESTPERLGFPGTPTLMRSIRELMERRERRKPAAEKASAGFDQVDEERLRATLTRFWPVDRPLLDGLDRIARRLAQSVDTEPPAVVAQDLTRHLGLLLELLSRSQRSDHARELARIAAAVGQNLGFTSWVMGDAAETYRTYATAESLARESRSGSQLAQLLVDRSEMAGQVARTTDAWQGARELADTAETAALMDPTTPPGVLAWIYGERSLQRAELGDEKGSGRDLEQMDDVRLDSPPEALNIFSPDLSSAWVDRYHARRALRLGHAEEALAACEVVLRGTDPRLSWERAPALIQLAEAWLLKGELRASVECLREAIDLLHDTGNARDLRAVHRIMNGVRRRWGRVPELRDLDDLLRS